MKRYVNTKIYSPHTTVIDYDPGKEAETMKKLIIENIRDTKLIASSKGKGLTASEIVDENLLLLEVTDCFGSAIIELDKTDALILTEYLKDEFEL